MSTTATEPFPQTTSIRPRVNNSESRPRLRRKSSNLPVEPPGDTGNAVSTSTLSENAQAKHRAGETSPAPKSSRTRGHKRRKAKSLARRFRSLALRHTWLLPLILMLVILGLYAINPTSSNPIHSMIFLSYALPHNDPLAAKQYERTTYWSQTTQYGKGGRDFAFVGFYMIVLSFTREFIMQRFIRPWAVWCGIRGKAKQARFMEQAYTAVYFLVFGPYGLYIMKRSPIWYFDTTAMFVDFPHRTHEGLFKAYYLLQAAYWAQQALVLMLQLEKPRKDFKELVAHHIVTIALIWLSYRFHFTYMGLAVYITHDVSDFFLATSKLLNYVDSPITGPYFFVFACIWAYCRHYLNLRIIWATLTEFRSVGPFELDWVEQQYKCWISQPITASLLICLQSVNIFWFFLILRIAKKIAIDNIKEDDRSEYGSDDEEGERTHEKRERMAAVAEVTHLQENGHAEPVHVQSKPELHLNGKPAEEEALLDSPAGNTRSNSRRRRKA